MWPTEPKICTCGLFTEVCELVSSCSFFCFRFAGGWGVWFVSIVLTFIDGVSAAQAGFKLTAIFMP